MKFNEKLINLRKKEGLSQEELGYKLNVTRQTVSKWELGQTTPEMDKLSELSKIFNVSVDELISESDFSSNQSSVIKDNSLGIKGFKNNKLVLIIVGVLLAIALLLGIKAITSSINNRSNVVEENILDKSDSIFDKFTNIFDKFFGLFNNALDSQKNILENQENAVNEFNITKFNGGLQIYSGSSLGGSVKSLLDTVITSNNTNDKKITVKYLELETQNVDEIKNIKSSFDDFNNFEVSFSYDEEGYINEVIIEKVISELEIKRFNGSFEIYSGSSMGGNVTVVLDKIITNNKTNDRKITTKYLETETQNENEIRNIKKQIGTFDNYEIIFEYDADGFIYKAIIEKV